jgi:hypothetical protein
MMRSIILMILCCLFASIAPVTTHATQPLHLWSQRFGDVNQADFVEDFAVDGDGNIYMVGTFWGTTNFGGYDLTSAGNGDIYLAKFNAFGVHQWSMRFGDAAHQVPTGIVVDASANIYFTGQFEGTVTFGTTGLVSAGSNDIFLCSFDTHGAHRWSKRFGDGASQQATAIALDPTANVIIAGVFDGTVNFGGADLTSAGRDIFVAKFSSLGGSFWSRRYGDAAFQYPNSIVADAASNVYFAGEFYGSLNFGGGNLTSAGANDVFLAKLNFAGNYLWAQRYGDASSQFGPVLALDAAGNVYITGEFMGTINLGGGNFVNPEIGTTDVFLARLTAAGVHVWSQAFGSTSTTTADDLMIDPNGGLYLTGDFGNAVNFGCGALTSRRSDPFVARFDLNGVCSGACGFGVDATSDNLFIDVDASGLIRLAGTFRGAVDFGGGPWYTPDPLSNPDMFLVTLSAQNTQPSIASIQDIRNDQGRRVLVDFDASAADVPMNSSPVTEYQLYLRNDVLPSPAAGDKAQNPPAAPPGSWILAGSAPAHNEDNYLAIASTLTDSTITNGMHWSVLFVRAATGHPAVFYDSEIDSGYSVDNLAPGVPGSFMIVAGVLSWKESKAPDFDYFTVYGSNDGSFGTATVVDYTVSTTLDVNASGYLHYWVTATDFSGNEGLPAHVTIASGTGQTPESYVLSIAAFPNPFNPSTTIRYTLPDNGHVEVVVYDARGLRVVTLVDDVKPRGAHVQPWDGRNGAGEVVGSGVYFARISHASGTRSYKMVLLK